MTETAPKRFTHEERIRITEDHLLQHDGIFRAEDFVEEARHPEHPAHNWFEWDNGIAADSYRLWQARRFVSLKVLIPEPRVTDLSKDGTILKVTYRPLLVSPIETRDDGGGYISTDSPEGRAFLLQEAVRTGYQWLHRYTGVLTDQERAGIEGVLGEMQSRQCAPEDYAVAVAD